MCAAWLVFQSVVHFPSRKHLMRQPEIAKTFEMEF